eukprot:CAMPEP_0170076186 /NCGR_PEP_ID=MMETSP0019_2-20121128/13200_1 /TAXON_ID=98059 /ORGANISM="Dinobryon sp., Strain UTEXLB2267" /LENGTH=492 /DNA_ID=CAMNT_0010287657 /DNA_START=398 /DNA_END=1876 /DNA_ORIENTATION=-
MRPCNECVFAAPGPQKGILPNALSFDHMGALLACGSMSGAVHVYDFDEYLCVPWSGGSLRPVRSLQLQREVSCVEWSRSRPDELAVGFSFSAAVSLWDVGGVASPRVCEAGSEGGGSAVLRGWTPSRGERLLAGSAQGLLRCWDWSGGSSRPQLLWKVAADPVKEGRGGPGVVGLALVAPPAGPLLVAWLGGGVVALWDLLQLAVGTLGPLCGGRPVCLHRLALQDLPQALGGWPAGPEMFVCLADGALQTLTVRGVGRQGREEGPGLCVQQEGGGPGRGVAALCVGQGLCLQVFREGLALLRRGVGDLPQARAPLLTPPGLPYPALSLPGWLQAARPGEALVRTSQSLEAFLQGEGPALPHRSRLLWLSWDLPGGRRASAGVRVRALLPGHLLALALPFPGPAVEDGLPRVRLQTFLLPRSLRAPEPRWRDLALASSRPLDPLSAAVLHPTLPLAVLALPDESLKVLRPFSDPEPQDFEDPDNESSPGPSP